MNEEKITISTMLLVSFLRSAADALQAASHNGMVMLVMKGDISLREFMRFCLGLDEL